MNILMLGWGAKQGSWHVRGVQLGAVMGARVTSEPTAKDWAWAEIAVIVKRSEPRFGPEARARGIPIVWDALDFWKQPTENDSSETRARQLLAYQLAVIQPALFIGATAAMAVSAGGAYLSHHGRPGLCSTWNGGPVRTVGYEGNTAYLGRWAPALEAACRARGWSWVVNPPDLSALDIVVALRDGPWDGWMCREWKSGVKLVNAIAAGRPVITQASAAWREIQPCGSLVETIADLPAALDAWSSEDVREDVFARSQAMAAGYTVEAIGRRYLELLSRVARQEVRS